MLNPNLSDTQPVRRAGGALPAPASGNKPPVVKRRRLVWLAWVLVAAFLAALSIAVGALAGYQSGTQARGATQADLGKRSIQEQYDLAAEDLSEGRYDLARQRFEYVLGRDASFPGAADGLAKAVAILYATTTPTPVIPTATTAPTPTPDLRPVQDLFAQAQRILASGDWTATIDTLTNLRKADSKFQAGRVDGMLYLALRMRGVDKILTQNDLEGGTYDLALAERFGPLDSEAEKVRGWARLYIYGSSFWEAYPEQAVYYFSQVAAAAPFLRDGSGWTARDRYWASLIQFGDQFAKNNDWCKAQAQYELALSIQATDSLQTKAADAAQACATPTPLPSTTASLTPTPTTTETPTLEIGPSPTATPTTPTAVESSTPTVTSPAPTHTPTQPAPTETPTSTATALPPTDTPTPTHTLTPANGTPGPVINHSDGLSGFEQIMDRIVFVAISVIKGMTIYG